MDTVPEDEPEFQGMLEEETPFPNVSAELPGVILEEEEEGDYQVVTNEPKPALERLAAVALENAGIDAAKQIWAAKAAADAAARAGVIAAQPNNPCLIEANEDKIVYKITFDMPVRGLSRPMTTWWSFWMQQLRTFLQKQVIIPHDLAGVW